MQYRRMGNTGVTVSALGFGAMRLPTLDGIALSPDVDETKSMELLRYAIDHGVNYVDTAYFYHGGISEVVVGRALKDGYREKIQLATKAPVIEMKQESDFDRLFKIQKHRLDMECFDFYLLHAVNRQRWMEIVEPLQLVEKMKQLIAEGKVKHIGFSFHDDFEAFKMIADRCDWDMCQIQMNYVDVDHQATLQALDYAAAKGMGVVIMEPLLGGKLAAPPLQVDRLLNQDKSPVEWALDFLWNRPEVSVILSGMNAMAQVKDNIAYAERSEVGMLSEVEQDMLAKAKVVYETMALVPCTKCSYCMPCPFGLDIPKIYEAYNKTAAATLEEAKKVYQTMEITAADCQKCGACEHACPQDIKSTELMPKIAEVFA